MKLKLLNDKEIEIKLKGRHTTKIMKLYAGMTDDTADTGKALLKYNEELDAIACEALEMTLDQLDDMDAEDKNLILNKIQEVGMGKLDFVKSSLTLDGSAQKAKKE